MKKVIYILSILLTVSCELGDLQENTGMLSGSYYINQAWEYFQAEDYTTAEELFAAPLDSDNREYDKLAYMGLGWTMIYKSKADLSLENNASRQSMRDSSEVYFDIAFEKYSQGNDTTATELELDILYAGLAFSKSYTAFKWQEEYFSEGLDSQYWDQVVLYSNKVIEYANSIKNNEFVFPYDDQLDYDVINFLKVQTYLRLDDPSSAVVELNKIDNCGDCTELNIYGCIDDCYYGEE